MILGVGNDMIDIRRIETTLENNGDRNEARVNTDIEKTNTDTRAHLPASYAKRFAAN